MHPYKLESHAEGSASIPCVAGGGDALDRRCARRGRSSPDQGEYMHDANLLILSDRDALDRGPWRRGRLATTALGILRRGQSPVVSLDGGC